MGWGSRLRSVSAGLLAALAAACGKPDSEPASSHAPPSRPDTPVAASPPSPPAAPPSSDAKPGQPAAHDPSLDPIPAPILYEALQRRFGLKVRLPKGLEVCGPTYDQSVRAVWARLDGSDCESPGASIGYYGDYLMPDIRPAKDALAFAGRYCSAPSWALGAWRKAVAGLETAMCREDKPDGSIEILLFAVAGEESFNGETFPAFVYRFSFSTTKQRYERDVVVLNDFLSSARLAKDAGGCCGPLGQIPPPPP